MFFKFLWAIKNDLAGRIWPPSLEFETYGLWLPPTKNTYTVFTDIHVSIIRLVRYTTVTENTRDSVY